MEGVKRKTVEEIRKGVASSCNNYIHISRVFRATHMRLGEGLAIINARINSLSLSLSLSHSLWCYQQRTKRPLHVGCGRWVEPISAAAPAALPANQLPRARPGAPSFVSRADSRNRGSRGCYCCMHTQSTIRTRSTLLNARTRICTRRSGLFARAPPPSSLLPLLIIREKKRTNPA